MKKLLPLIALAVLAFAPEAIAATSATTSSTGSTSLTCPDDVKQVIQNASLSVTQGGTGTASFTINPACASVQVSLVSYTHSAPYFTWENASDEVVYDRKTQTLGPGNYSFSVRMPDCYYQLDLVRGDVIEKLGPANSLNFYSRQYRLVAAENGGTKACATITAPPPPVDVCPNIEGTQTSVPSGYVKENGVCFIPPVDVCPNLTGLQTSVPSGMVKTELGICVTPPTVTVTDECPNLTSVQTRVPDNYIKDASGNCVPVPKDVCPNIEGTQSKVPDGLILKDGICATPPPPDVCQNIEGIQTKVPVGHVTNEDSICVPETTPVDVCTNLAGDQQDVPQGMTRKDGICAKVQVKGKKKVTRKDVCVNIKGIQTKVPKGKVKKGASCVKVAVKGKKAAKPGALPYTP